MQQRRRLHRFKDRPLEYKKVFDMVIRSYFQLRDSLFNLEEFWVHLNEAIFGKVLEGRLYFDKIWKTFF